MSTVTSDLNYIVVRKDRTLELNYEPGDEWSISLDREKREPNEYTNLILNEIIPLIPNLRDEFERRYLARVLSEDELPRPRFGCMMTPPPEWFVALAYLVFVHTLQSATYDVIKASLRKAVEKLRGAKVIPEELTTLEGKPTPYIEYTTDPVAQARLYYAVVVIQNRLSAEDLAELIRQFSITNEKNSTEIQPGAPKAIEGKKDKKNKKKNKHKKKNGKRK